MNPVNNKALLIPANWRETFDALPDKAVAQLVRAAFSVASGDEPPEIKGVAAPLWPILRDFVEQNSVRYSAVCEKRRKAAEERWKRKNGNSERGNHANASFASAQNANASDAYANDMQKQILHGNTKTKTKTKTKTNISPLPPLSRGTIDRLVRVIGKFYRRRVQTPWSEKEGKALAGIVRDRPEALGECARILRLYRSGYPYARRDILTLLNNWTVELDRAGSWRPPAAQIQTGAPRDEFRDMQERNRQVRRIAR